MFLENLAVKKTISSYTSVPLKMAMDVKSIPFRIPASKQSPTKPEVFDGLRMSRSRDSPGTGEPQNDWKESGRSENNTWTWTQTQNVCQLPSYWGLGGIRFNL
jgi:hypothetical protein